MFKNLSHLNKQTIIALILVFGLVFMLLINLIILVPQLIDVYTSSQSQNKVTPIDTATVNNAIELLEKGP